MAEAENPRAVVGGNNPPETDPLIVEANERVDTANRYLTERADVDQWTQEIADRANFFIEQVDGTHKVLNEQRLQEGRDFDAKQKAKYQSPLSLLIAAKTKLQDLRRAYLKKQEDRLEAERKAKAEEARKLQEAADEVARKAAEEAKKKGGDPLRAEQAALKAQVAADEAAIAAETAPTKATISGQYSSRATGLKDHWRAEIEDVSAAFKHYNKASNPVAKLKLATAIKEVIQDLADKDARAMKVEGEGHIPGIKIVKERR